jgi:3D (Asp-Asp-Asp) domain-containing protein
MAEIDNPEVEPNTAASPPTGGSALGRLQGLFSARKTPASSLKGSAIQILVGGKAKLVIPGVAILAILLGAIFFLISAVAVYASRLGSVPGYAGGISSGSCPASTGYLVTNDTFDTTGDKIAVTSVPDISQATLTETASIAMTTYCPTVSGIPDPVEGGQSVKFGIRPGIGNIAVPNDPARFPLGRTVIDIPGVGLRVATDIGGKIRANSSKGGDFDVDLFVGYAEYGTHNCDKYSDKWIHDTPGGSGHVLAGAKVYVFKNWDDATARSNVKTYDNNPACLAAHQAPTGSGGMAVQVASKEIGNTDYTKYTGGNHDEHAWCAFFVTWVYKAAGFDVPSMGGPEAVRDYFKAHTDKFIWIDGPASGQVLPGDIFVIQYDGDNKLSISGYHIGIVESVEGDILHTIEGNAGRDDSKGIKSSVKPETKNINGVSGKYKLVGVGRPR